MFPEVGVKKKSVGFVLLLLTRGVSLSTQCSVRAVKVRPPPVLQDDVRATSSNVVVKTPTVSLRVVFRAEVGVLLVFSAPKGVAFSIPVGITATLLCSQRHAVSRRRRVGGCTRGQGSAQPRPPRCCHSLSL